MCLKFKAMKKGMDCLYIFRLIVLFIAFVFEVVVASLSLNRYYLETTNRNSSVYQFFSGHSNQILMTLGIFSIILLLPVEEYAARGYIEDKPVEIPENLEMNDDELYGRLFTMREKCTPLSA